MKSFNISLLAAGLFLLSSCASESGEAANEKRGNKKKPQTPMAEMSGGGLNMAYVNTDSILSKYELYKELEEEMISERISMETRFKEQVSQFEREYQYAMQEAPNLPQDKLNMLQMELEQKQNMLMQSEQQIEQRLMASQQTKNDRLYGAIQDFLADYSKQEGYDIILGYNGFSTVLYADERFDITGIVVDSLNTIYLQENGPTADSAE